MNTNWLNKYYSNNLKDYDNNQENINNIINNILNKDIKSLIIKGDTGIGKNNIINLIAKKLKYNINRYKLNNKKEISLIEYYNNITMLKKQMILINKVDYITTINEKKNIQNINKLSNNSKNNIFIIYFVEKTITKTIKEINKNTKLIEINYPSNKLLNNIIIKIIKKEKINIDTKIYSNIVNLCQSDIRKLILILKDLKYTFQEDFIDIDNFNKFLKYTKLKIKNFNINETTKLVMNNYNYIDCQNYYNNDKVILPLMIYENFINKIKYNNDLLVINLISKISNCISIADIIETNIYTDQNWYLQNIHGYFSIINTSYYLNNYKDIKDTYDISFSSDLNKTSLKNINKKNYNNIKTSLNKSFNDILSINYIISELIKNNNIDDIIKYIKNYNLSFKIIDMIIKINKINKIQINNIQKKVLQNYK
jgi:hypothetical protein